MKYAKNQWLILACCLMALIGKAQTINWRSLDTERKHLVNLNAGFDYGFSYGLGYGYRLPSKIPLVVNIEYSAPFGKQVFDDLKTKVGVQAEIVRVSGFSAAFRFFGNFRRYENALVRIASFGSEVSGTAGFYRRRWFAAAELGFDKAIATHLHHTPAVREDFPDIPNGWFVPTAGHFTYGLQTGFSALKNDWYLKIGKVVAQDFKSTPLVPYYFQFGWNRRF